jgi:hypothetical protein
MRSALALHTAARRYCLERHAHWSAEYSKLVSEGGDREPDGYHYTPAALATFPRYNVLKAILVEVERIDPSRLGDLEDTRDLLALAGQVAEDAFTRGPAAEISVRSMLEEREAFRLYVAGIEPSDLQSIDALPFRRVLTAHEAGSIRSGLSARWQVSEGYWFPLAACSLHDVVAFNTEGFEAAIDNRDLQGILRRHGVERVWELREYGPEYEQDITLLAPQYNGAEGYWCSAGLDWIVYASHESSVTIGGWLLHQVQGAWPQWQAHEWTAAFK